MTSNTITPTEFILPLTSASASLELAGGKGANLVRLARADLPVPGGFLVTTRAYQAFVDGNHLASQIEAALPDPHIENPASLEAASERIRSIFQAGAIPPALAEPLCFAYSQFGGGAVAVRSSATAEDLPGMSFAGQQDTFLNVLGTNQLLQAIVSCWSSLWTARAIGYRAHHHVTHASVSLAVVVQSMVESQVSGVLFTANPLTGLRSETVIDATLGLGEALVSGLVEPDHYVVDTSTEKVVSKTLGAKALSIRSQPGGGTVKLEETSQLHQALPDPYILELTRLGQRVARLYDFPQDIEFAWVGGKLYLLQSRPITSLYPIPQGLPVEPLQVLVSLAAVQGMLDPITPLGRYMFQMLFATFAMLFGRKVNADTQTVLYPAGERLWINISAIVRNSVGRRIALGALGFVEPSVRQSLLSIQDDPRLQPGRPGIRFRALRQLAGFFLPLAANIILNLAAPERRRSSIIQRSEATLAEMQVQYALLSGDRRTRLAQLMDLTEALIRKHLPPVFILFVSGVASGMASFAGLNRLVSGLQKDTGIDWNDKALELTRGLAHNPTTEMDLTLWQAAQSIRRDPSAMAEFQAYSASELSRRFLGGGLSASTQSLVESFLEQYGARGLAEIDLGRPRWYEDPTHIFDVLGSYLRIDIPEQAPDVVFARGADAARQTLDELCSALRKTHGGWLKVLQARFFAGRMRALMGMRESPKFFAIRVFGLVRRQLLVIGRQFVDAGELDAPDDLVYLTNSELRRLAANEPVDWKALVIERRAAYQRELLRRQIPRMLLSDGRAFYEGMAAPAGQEGLTLAGSPVSPGSIEGLVRIVMDPRQAHLLPGEILVCPGTDPSWTPLFLTAAGLIMEVGGMMTHGAVVAREYGIPAVVGVDQATHRLSTGQHIRLDGSSGIITLL